MAQSARLLHEQREPSDREVQRPVLLRLVVLSPDGVPSAVRVAVSS